jgi:hypothetical protein
MSIYAKKKVGDFKVELSLTANTNEMLARIKLLRNILITIITNTERELDMKLCAKVDCNLKIFYENSGVKNVIPHQNESIH